MDLMERTKQSQQIQESIDRAAHYLPAQGPIGVFVAQNILVGFEDEPFEEAVVHAARIFGTEPFLTETRYREELARGRIRSCDLESVLDADLGQRAVVTLAGGRVTLRTLLLGLLEHPLRQEDDAAVRWTLTESNAVDHDATADLWHACVEAAALTRPTLVHVQPPVRHRDLILAIDPSVDTDAMVHPLLIRVCAAFLDQGVAAWPMPGRERGLLAAVADIYSGAIGPTEPWSSRLPAAMAAIQGTEALAVIADELKRLGVPPEYHDELITRSLVALRGWAGMIRQFEERPDRAPVEAVPARLVDFLALRLVLDRVAAEWAASRLGRASDLPGLWTELRDRYPPRRGPGSVARAYLLYQVSQLLGLSAHDIRALDENELLGFESAIAEFDGVVRRRIFHLAYERRHRIEVLDGLASHVAVASLPSPERPLVQAIFCIDDRCESFRRYLEEMGPRYETFGTAGFFAVPMYYRGIDDWHATPLCPIVMRPEHTVLEVPQDSARASHHLRQSIRRRLGQLTGSMSSGSRTLFRGGLFTVFGGAIAAVPLVARVVFPRLTTSLSQRVAAVSRSQISTRLQLERLEADTLPNGTHAGFDVNEMARIVQRMLDDIGLQSRFSRIVAVIGHGSSSLNNPHESAYDCGACGGGRGGPNARAFAIMANDSRVRAIVATRGIAIPEETFFVAGMQDTCSDTVVWFEADRVPKTHSADMRLLDLACRKAGASDAQERCRRFDSAPLNVTAAAALRHVSQRAGDLAQVRPELGHATNAVCVIGRRYRTRGLFLDRRAFLVSYDPTTDQDGEILTRTLAAVGPVGSGINLTYLFSHLDSIGYGCGTKLPHNITGLLGVMDGHASDLRTGLPWQMVEIHEPVRLLIVIDATPESILAAVDRLPSVKRLVFNRWVQVVAWEADGTLAIFENGLFVPYSHESDQIAVVQRSADWFIGHRTHLPPARVMAALAEAGSPKGVGA